MTTPSASPLLPGTLSAVELLYPDMVEEFAATRKTLERVPDGKNDWKPHDKSYSLGGLADHIAELPGFALSILTSSELDLATMEWKPANLPDAAARLTAFDDISGKLKTALDATDWATLSEAWTLRSGSQVYLTEQKAKLVRTFGFSHIAHHRAQLGVYLRLLGVAVPGPYGPSADEM